MKIATIQYSLETESFEIFVSGCCGPHCDNCHNPELWDYAIGKSLNDDFLIDLKNNIESKIDMIKNIFILGGEPLDQSKEEIIKLLNFLKQFKKPLWLFTKYEKKEVPKELFQYLNYIKCGRYVPGKKVSNRVKFGIRLATSNQNIYCLN